ncbi:MAG TPA: cytochrome c3 family protein [Gemmatimonadota bacterium]|nr:cytochrome c3 family protein [Gemmatimonadota bacterium]
MRRVRRLSLTLAALALAGGVLATGCTDRVTVFKQKPFFENPPSAAANFLGYADTTNKQTVCGECHVGVQARWEKSKHAEAWADLEASGHANDSCRQCHSVNQFGNVTTDSGGWVTTKDARYRDVQCESCHGPGLKHVQNPDVASNQPIPSIAVDTVLSSVTNGCAECHNGTHHPFVEQWARSKHAQVIDFAAAREECAACHSGQGALKAWGVSDTYVEANGDPLPTTCAVCHSPHGTDNTAQLRFPIETSSIETHLCARCHNYGTAPNPSTHGLTPMAPEAQLLVGTAGYFPPDLDISSADSIRGTHGSDANPALCATCHVASFAVNDPATGDFQFQAVGHTFNAIPCLDQSGIPSGELDCPITTAARDWSGCTASGCHSGGPSVARSILITRLSTVRDRSDTLLALLTRVDANLGGAGGAIDPNDGTLTVAEGAFFNYNLANWTAEVNDATYTNADVALLGSTVHNPFLITTLLDASIQAVADAYPSASVSPAYRQKVVAELADLRTKGKVH